MSARLSGVVGSPGIAIGPVAVIRPRPAAHTQAPDGDPGQRLRQAQTTVARHLEQLAAELRTAGKPDEAAIFDAQALLATDPALVSQAEHHLHLQPAGAISLEAAVSQATESLAAQLGALDDAYLRERAADVRAVGQQLIRALSGLDLDLEPAVPAGCIVVADELTPTQLMALRRHGLVGFAAVHGAPTGHLALLARALDLPALLGVDASVLAIADGSPAILVASGDAQLIVEPTADELDRYARLNARQQVEAAARKTLLGLPTTTADGHPLQLWANLGRPEEAEPALDLGAEGVGLFRTEFLFLDRDRPPTEDEQYAAYVQVLEVMRDRPVVVRTLDVGGDKPSAYLPMLAEANPFLGTRGIRLCMRYPELFRAQLTALLRAALAGDLRILLPMVATPEDVAWARHQLAEVAADLDRAGVPHRADVPLGIMVETPAAAVALDRLAEGLQFCSIGSNDLAQYTLAADRGDAALARRYRPDDPAVFRLIRTTVESAGRLGLEISLCGELAADPAASVALVGLGLEKLSLSPPALLEVKAALRGVTLEQARRRGAQACGDAAPGPARHPPAALFGSARPFDV